MQSIINHDLNFAAMLKKDLFFNDYHYSIYIYPSEGRHGYYEDALHHPIIIIQENVLKSSTWRKRAWYYRFCLKSR